MVDHLAGHAAVDADVLAGDEASLVGAEIQHHVGDVQGIAHAARRLLHSVRAFIDCVLGVDPARGDGVDAHLPRQTDRQRVGQGGDATLGGRVALGLRLTHTVAGGGDVDDGGTFGEIRDEEFGKVERGCHAHAQGILEFFVAALRNPLHQRQGVVDEVVHTTVLRNYLFGELLQHIFVGKVADEVVARLLVDDTNGGPGFPELLGDASSDALRAARDDGNFVVEILIYTPLKILFRGKFVLRNEYLLESVQVILFHIGAKIVIFRELSAQPAPITPVFCNDLSRFSARVLYPRQHLHQLGAGKKTSQNTHYLIQQRRV